MNFIIFLSLSLPHQDDFFQELLKKSNDCCKILQKSSQYTCLCRSPATSAPNLPLSSTSCVTQTSGTADVPIPGWGHALHPPQVPPLLVGWRMVVHLLLLSGSWYPRHRPAQRGVCLQKTRHRSRRDLWVVKALFTCVRGCYCVEKQIMWGNPLFC